MKRYEIVQRGHLIMEDNYPKAYTEVIEVLNYVPRESVNKIPSSVLETLGAKCDKNYDFKIDTSKSFEEQELLEETKAILTNIFRDYWATQEQRTAIVKKEEADRKCMISEIPATEESLPLDYNNASIEEKTNRRSFLDLLDAGDVPPLRTIVDITFVLDAAHAKHYKENVQLKIDDYWYDFMKIYVYYHIPPNSLRISIVWFNDSSDGPDHWYQRLGFNSFPDEKNKILDYFTVMDDLRISGQRTAMDAVYEAAESDWNQDGDKIRHIIVLMTDHEDSIQKECCYNDKLPSLEGFYMDWNYQSNDLLNLGANREAGYNGGFKSLNPYGRRMIIISPPLYPYNEMELECDYVIRYDVEQGKKCDNIKSETIFQLITYSI